MKPSIFNQLFKIKYGNRSEGYDVENAIPGWDEQFDKLLADLNIRKKLFEKVCSMYGHSQNKTIDVRVNLMHVTPIFQEIIKLSYVEKNESIVAQEALMLIYGIKIAINLLPLVVTEKDAGEFYVFYNALQNIGQKLNETYKNDEPNFWHRYAFKIGLHFLALLYKAKEVGEKFFEVDKYYCLYFKNMGGGGAGALYYILPSIVNLPKGSNQFLEDFLQKEVKRIVDSGLKK